MVLQATPQVCKLDGRDWTTNSAILIRVKYILAGIHQNAVAIYVSLILNRFVWLSPIIKRNWVGPNVLFSLTYLLSIVLPVHTLPEEIIVNTMLKARPYCCSGIRRR